jgi:hypothetical protein
MNKDFKIPPKSVNLLSSPEILIKHLDGLIGNQFMLTGKTKTDGSNLRKLIAATLEKYPLPELAPAGQYEIVPPKGKGVPKIRREFIDTYLGTSGSSYNLQVWNRIPASHSLLVKYESGESLKCSAVRFVLVRVNITGNFIVSIIIMTPEYIESKFGKFGKPTIKNQLLISSKVRKTIYESNGKILSFPDTKKISYYLKDDYHPPKTRMVEEPELKNLFSIQVLKKIVAEKLIGQKLISAATKTRGQALEKLVLDLLGYETKENDLLYGAFPDIRNQLLEVKVQDAQTVDLGRFSPEREEIVIEESGLTTFDVRYLIALTDPKTEIIEGIILSPGEKLGELFSYVSAESYKCQRSIPMTFFDKYSGKAVFNPD